jgi:hypothetical protein
MKFRAVLTLLFAIFCVVLVQALKAQAKFDKAMFYRAIASENIQQIDTQLGILKGSDIAEKEGYEGALLMQKAGMKGGPKEKLSLFKSGHKKLENAISKDGKNIEYRFLRLMIQENAPKVLGYHFDLEKDSDYIRKNFKKLSPIIQNAIVGYSKKSKVLNPKEFQG